MALISKAPLKPSNTAINLVEINQHLKDHAATLAFGEALGRVLKTGDVVALSGGLGAGKSTLARGVIAQCLAAQGQAIGDIPSPTFTLVQPYPWPSAEDPAREIWHIDLWRIEHPDEMIELGFDDAIGRHAMLIEWPERLGGSIPDALHVTLTEANGGAGRNLTLTSKNQDWQARLEKLTHPAN